MIGTNIQILKSMSHLANAGSVALPAQLSQSTLLMLNYDCTYIYVSIDNICPL